MSIERSIERKLLYSRAEILFAAYEAESDIEGQVDEWIAQNMGLASREEAIEKGMAIEGLRWDYYDKSLEIDGFPADLILTDSQIEWLFDQGFRLVFVNHTADGWETVHEKGYSKPIRRKKA